MAWGEEKPSLQETRVHAKCLRSVTSVRDYFREYRAKKRGVSRLGGHVCTVLRLQRARCCLKAAQRVHQWQGP